MNSPCSLLEGNEARANKRMWCRYYDIILSIQLGSRSVPDPAPRPIYRWTARPPDRATSRLPDRQSRMVRLFWIFRMLQLLHGSWDEMQSTQTVRPPDRATSRLPDRPSRMVRLSWMFRMLRLLLSSRSFRMSQVLGIRRHL